MALFGLEQAFLVQLSLAIIGICVVVIVAAIAAYVYFSRKSRTPEELTASHVLKHLETIRKGGTVPKPSKEEKPKASLEIKGDELTLKQMLTTKFKPVIERQLKSKVEIKDFNAKGNQFLALILVGGVKLLLVLDSSGKIVDYKRVK